jgi:hypothetical protein
VRAGGAQPHPGRGLTAWDLARKKWTIMEAFKQFVGILVKPDNIPIAGMLVLVLFFTYLALRQALLNDRLIAEGREDEILKHMQK